MTKTWGIDVGLVALGFRDELLDDDKDHGARRKTERIRENALHL